MVSLESTFYFLDPFGKWMAAGPRSIWHTFDISVLARFMAFGAAKFKCVHKTH